jgi:hypothetical protein
VATTQEEDGRLALPLPKLQEHRQLRNLFAVVRLYVLTTGVVLLLAPLALLFVFAGNVLVIAGVADGAPRAVHVHVAHSGLGLS